MNANNDMEKLSITNGSITNTTPTTTPISIFDYNWLNDLNTVKVEYIYALIGITLNIAILVISAKKKREKEQTYRVIILYIACVAIVRDVCRIMYYVLLFNLFSNQYLNYLQHVWYLIMYDSTSILAIFSQDAILMLFSLFSLNRFLAVIHPITFSIHMTTKRVHIYCNAIIALNLIGLILYISEIVFPLSYTYLFMIATFTELLITPTTSIWIIVKLLLHIRVLENLNDRSGIIEMILISLSLLIQSIYAIIVVLPAFAFQFWRGVDNASFFNAYFLQHSSLSSWVLWGYSAYQWGPDTMFYAANLLIVVRVYAKAFWIEFPLFIYRKTCNRTNQVATTIDEMPMTPMNNNYMNP